MRRGLVARRRGAARLQVDDDGRAVGGRLDPVDRARDAHPIDDEREPPLGAEQQLAVVGEVREVVVRRPQPSCGRRAARARPPTPPRTAARASAARRPTRSCRCSCRRRRGRRPLRRPRARACRSTRRRPTAAKPTWSMNQPSGDSSARSICDGETAHECLGVAVEVDQRCDGRRARRVRTSRPGRRRAPRPRRAARVLPEPRPAAVATASRRRGRDEPAQVQADAGDRRGCARARSP